MTAKLIKFLLLFSCGSFLFAETADIDSVYQRKIDNPIVEILEKVFPVRPFEKSYALIIGIGDYDNGFSKLSVPLPDAIRVRDFLIEDALFDHVHMLTNGAATKGKIEKLMEEDYPAMLGKNDRFLFYFSGHGTQRTVGKNTVGYLPLKSSGTRTYSNMISMSDINEWDALLSNAKHTLFILDCCFGGLADIERKASQEKIKIDNLGKYAHELITAGTANQISVGDISKWNGSLFTNAFINGAKGAADFSSAQTEQDGIVSLTELLNFIRNEISIEMVNDRTIRMTPQIKRQEGSEGENFFLNRAFYEKKEESANDRIPTSAISKKGAKNNETGSITIFSVFEGDILIDNKFLEHIDANSSIELENYPPVDYKIQLQTVDSIWTQLAHLPSGGKLGINFLKKPDKVFRDPANDLKPMGSLKVLNNATKGDLFINGRKVIALKRGETFNYANISVGPKKVLLKGKSFNETIDIYVREGANHSVVFRKDQTTLSGDDMAPMPPQGLTITGVR